MLLDRFGCALLLDCHSMPPPPDGQSADRLRRPPRPDGDALGQPATAMAIARRVGLRRPGSTIPSPADMSIERHARPARGVHALQIEIDRALLSRRRAARAGAGIRPRRPSLLETLAVELGEALLGRRIATAAE